MLMKKVSTWKLQIRMILATMILFALIYALVTLVGIFLGISGPLFYVGFALVNYTNSVSGRTKTGRVVHEGSICFT